MKLNNFDIIINATSLGLKNEKVNFDFSNIGSNKLFYDVIYNPIQTNFLKIGKETGNLSENGIHQKNQGIHGKTKESKEFRV